MSDSLRLHPETKYSTDPKLRKELQNGHIRLSDANSMETLNPELNMKKLWRSPLPTLSKQDRDFNIAQFVKDVWERLQLAAKRVVQSYQPKPALTPRPKPKSVNLDDKLDGLDYTYKPKNQLGISLPQLRYEISVMRRRIIDLSHQLRAVHTRHQSLQLTLDGNRNAMRNIIANAFMHELNMQLNREQVNGMYIVCQQFIRTQPTIINIQTNNEYMRLGASIVTAEKLRLVFERTDLQPLMEQHVLKQDGLQKQMHTLVGQQQKLFNEIEKLHEQLLGHQGLADKMGATLEWVAAAEAARAEMQMNPQMQMGM